MKPSEIIIRKATTDDSESITELLFGLKSQYGSCIENDLESFRNNYHEIVKEALSSSSNHIWISIVNSEIVGFMSYTTRLVLRLRGEVITMEELFVKENYRRLGLALEMYKESTKNFKENGLNHLEVVSSMAHKGQREWGKKIGLEWYSNIHRLKL